ncbi:TetR/AcrR family transcriptional regulator [Albimonas sp. CAU 1670]|uniref:TetR/AcrR family transcriptional regulator n=1 Tax=Albimonas sp. CAU 1670 TaxID=3032599 RepID=UPI0023DC94F5|nr:TetR/AcrR family transcriptional regulator [Albimonas sp. CAU 1670]MDF2235811.1 TetR/AcrR family transcriptional regulator [Albimonas sp. CAU 1670]
MMSATPQQRPGEAPAEPSADAAVEVVAAAAAQARDAAVAAPAESAADPLAAAEAARAQALEEVLAAAAVAFMERGFAATSIDDVARGMGATKGRVYHYYRSKLDLFTDVVRRSLERIGAQVAEAEAEGGTPRERMERMMRVHVRSILKDQPWHRCALQGVEMFLRESAAPEQRAAMADLIRLRHDHERLFLRVLDDGMETGAFRRCDAATTVRTLLPALNGAVYWYRPRDGETEAHLARIIDEIVAFALGGLEAR